MLNADELGEKGQAHFKEICADAKLVCNQSGRDRTGWDFIVEFPFDATDATTLLENRRVPLSCHVQVKTLLEKSDRFAMRLSAAERLAKEIKPSFVYIFKVNKALEYTGAYLVHLLDTPLGKILKRLRTEDLLGHSAANKKTITMSAKTEGVAMLPTGKALRSALESICGSDTHAYTVKKSAQLAELGFEVRPYEVTLALSLDSVDDLVDAFLGLAKDIPASDVRAAVTRFGIKKPLPSHSSKAATISIQPAPFDTCTITVRRDPLSIPGVFTGKVFLPAVPKLPRENYKILFDAGLIALTIGLNRWTIELRPDLPPQSLANWLSYWRFAQILANGSGTIQIVSDTKRIKSTLPISTKATAIDANECAHWIKLCEQACDVLKHVGVTEEPELSMENIYRNGTRISAIYSLIHPEIGKTPASFLTSYRELIPTPFCMEMLYVDLLELGPVILGYCGLGQVTGERLGDRMKWKADNITLVEITRLRALPQDYEEMIETAKNRTGCQNLWESGLNPAAEDKTLSSRAERD